MDHLELVIVALVALLMLAIYFIGRRSKGAGTITVHTSLERIRDVGELNVLTAYIKEVVTMTTQSDGLFQSSGKILLICGFDIEFRYDLKKIKIGNSATVEKPSILLPPHFIKVIPKETQFYDEQKATVLGIARDFKVEERNKLLHEARDKAIEQAGVLQGELQEKVRTSAKATLTALAEAFGAPGVTFAFEESSSVVQQLNDQLNKIAA